MILVMNRDCRKEEIEKVRKRLEINGFKYDVMYGEKHVLIPIVGDLTTSDAGRFESLACVEKVLRVSLPYSLVTRDKKNSDSVIDLGDGVSIGGKYSIIAGPCSVESEENLRNIAEELNRHNVRILRGGTFKMRSSPYSFQGMGEEGLKILRKISDRFGMKCVSEIPDIGKIDCFLKYTDIIQVGARSMNNYEMLRELGKTKKPILLKRSPYAKIEDFLLSAEYLILGGNPNVILCERGIRTFDDSSRNTINIASIPLLKKKTHLPVIMDPSHGTGNREIVSRVALASIPLGADGVLIETHTNPEEALSDGFQSLTPEDFRLFIKKAEKFLSI
ncbi:MAG: 3-deoxy-7-phosphoheptulonate synthase [bacterium]